MTTLTKRIMTAQRQERRNTGLIDENSKYPIHEYRVVTLEGTVTLQVDVERLVRVLGTAALKAKTKRAQEASGAVVAIASDVRQAGYSEWAKL